MPGWVQTLIVVTIIAVAGAYITRRAWKTMRSSGTDEDCGSDCGCDSPGAKKH